MIRWRATHHNYPSTSWWTVDEIDDHGQVIGRIVDCSQNEVLAHRIAKLPELETIVLKLPETKNKVRVVPQFDKVWFRHHGEIMCQVIPSDNCTLGGTVRECYSSEEELVAAEAAGKDNQNAR